MKPSVWSEFRRSHDAHRNNDVGNGVGWVIESFFTSSLSNGGISIRLWQVFLLNLADLLQTRLRIRRHRSEAHLYLAMLDSTFCCLIQGRHGLGLTVLRNISLLKKQLTAEFREERFLIALTFPIQRQLTTSNAIIILHRIQGKKFYIVSWK